MKLSKQSLPNSKFRLGNIVYLYNNTSKFVVVGVSHKDQYVIYSLINLDDGKKSISEEFNIYYSKFKVGDKVTVKGNGKRQFKIIFIATSKSTTQYLLEDIISGIHILSTKCRLKKV